jgi:hypothetical protein
LKPKRSRAQIEHEIELSIDQLEGEVVARAVEGNVVRPMVQQQTIGFISAKLKACNWLLLVMFVVGQELRKFVAIKK